MVEPNAPHLWGRNVCTIEIDVLDPLHAGISESPIVDDPGHRFSEFSLVGFFSEMSRVDDQGLLVTEKGYPAGGCSAPSLRRSGKLKIRVGDLLLFPGSELGEQGLDVRGLAHDDEDVVVCREE